MKPNVLARARELLERSGGAATQIALGAVGWFVAETGVVRQAGDDGLVLDRYAVNLVNGEGLVFNIGERVEGITSLLWTLVIAAGAFFGADPVGFGHWLGVASGALLLWLTY